MYGELAYGEKGKKSSANPDKCQALEGIYTHQARLSNPHTFLHCRNVRYRRDLQASCMHVLPSHNNTTGSIQ